MIVVLAGDEPGSLVLDEFGNALELPAPPTSLVVDGFGDVVAVPDPTAAGAVVLA